ncbi:uncharacterized protein DS421_19g639830 [Arachis hypogaea]|uniref:Uncharacterized protein n=1 Tax=Arachis hypogaea TaxID=3818 RepID=A0A6B9V6Z1_ARAHY|nr:uncharacterized protein DS421_19g639830 [Arachis hypogaea]
MEQVFAEIYPSGDKFGSRFLSVWRETASLSDPFLITAATSITHFLDLPASSSSFDEVTSPSPFPFPIFSSSSAPLSSNCLPRCRLIVIAVSSILIVVRFSPSRRQCRQSSSSSAIPPPLPRQIVSATDLPVAVSTTDLRIDIYAWPISCCRLLYLRVCSSSLLTARASKSVEISTGNEYSAGIGYPSPIADTGQEQGAFWGHKAGVGHFLVPTGTRCHS